MAAHRDAFQQRFDFGEGERIAFERRHVIDQDRMDFARHEQGVCFIGFGVHEGILRLCYKPVWLFVVVNRWKLVEHLAQVSRQPRCEGIIQRILRQMPDQKEVDRFCLMAVTPLFFWRTVQAFRQP